MAKLLGTLMAIGSGVLRTGTCMHFTGFQLVDCNLKVCIMVPLCLVMHR